LKEAPIIFKLVLIISQFGVWLSWWRFSGYFYNLSYFF